MIRIGETAFVGLPGEPFVESSLNIKLKSPAARTYVDHMPRYPDLLLHTDGPGVAQRRIRAPA